jgi:hypothetical protein
MIQKKINKNYSISNINQKFKSFASINNSNNLINSIKKKNKGNAANKSNDNNKNTMTKISHTHKKDLIESSINNLCKINTIKKESIINCYNYKKNKKSGLSCHLTKRNSPNISIEKKEFSKIVIIEPQKTNNNEKNKKEENKNNSIEHKKNDIIKKKSDKKISIIKKRNDVLIMAKTLKTAKQKNIDKIMTNKFLQAQEKWKNNYLATVIQKVFRGYSYRNKMRKKKLSNKNLSIYIKKMPKDKSLCKRKNKKNLTLINFRNNNKLIHTYTSSENLKENISSLSNNNMIIKRYNSPNKNPKIKEIIIKQKKNYPVVNLNLNNYFYPNYFYDYNNYYCNEMNKMITMLNDRNNNIEKYWQKIKLVGKLKKIIKFWLNISFKNKIIKSIIKTRKKITNKDCVKDYKSDDTHNTTNSLSEERRIIHFGMNTQ